MQPNFINDETAAAFLNAGTSEGAKAAWETRGAGPATLRADRQSNVALRATISGDNKKAAEEHLNAAMLHHAAASEAESRGDYEQQGYHIATEKFHRDRAAAHQKGTPGSWHNIAGVKGKVFVPEKE